MQKKLPVNYNIYESTYGDEVPSEQLFVHMFDSLPSKKCDATKSYDIKVVELIKMIGFTEIKRIEINNKRNNTNTQYVFKNEEKEIFIRVYGQNYDGVIIDSFHLEFMYKIENGPLEKQIDISTFDVLTKKKKKANIHLVKSDMGHLETEEFDIDIKPMDLELNYGEEFLKIHKTIVDRLNKPNDKGIILLHGDPGTGKTSYIKHITNLIKEKDVLFIPPSVAEILSEPSIIPFLMEHKNSILIIEDAERVIADRETKGSPAGVSNILNLTDGILGDCLNIQVIATFNMRREKIDQALLRKGRLICEHKFDKLSIENTNKLLKFLGKNEDVSEPMVLADIYNIDLEVYKTENKTNKIGFKN